ncbi:hypothetical protein TraAM80_03890 [Trypanosoma rangeli]|uniref:Leucine-rich repeat protein (LRRP) n=1 Tax=Trypanosoma rangeli TaxID=5698 RepID=A0A3R7RLB5_TRYRA|nr:uncharacterized protein TraAM80_03890 [Trypanosoma rangeli]RNF06423.1 hypothetical protein TraAM80_03890 [Trypanosoma rangeli]|eukprot:RNF06423.1 hypothetical protein TraAM80_03890 [Trypanosoma rangeli]
MIADNRERSIDFSPNPSGELDEEVLTRLRDALNSNDHYSKLIFNNNRLSDEAVGILAAILKGSTLIEYLSLSSCQVRDVDVMRIANALCVKKALRHLDLSNNPNISSAAAPDIARVIRTLPLLREVLLIGTGLQPAGCSKIVAAAEQNSSLKVLVLPYTVGFRILDRVRNVIEKRVDAKVEDLVKVEKAVKRAEPSLTDSPGTCDLGPTVSPWKENILPRLLLPPLTPSQRGGPMPTAELYCPTNSLRMMEFRCWADPAVKNAAVYLHELDKRCHLLEAHRQEKRERICAKRDVEGKNRAANRQLRYSSCDNFSVL